MLFRFLLCLSVAECKHRRAPSLQKGFTLSEILVAATLMVIVVAASGAGLSAVLNSSQNSRAQTERRLELSRSLDFIAAEVRQADLIDIDATANLSADAQAMLAAGPGPKTPVLSLNLPGVTGRVIYYLAPAPNPWRGPNAIFRWGPAYDINGNFTNANTPADWREEPLIDLISDEAMTPTCPSPGWQAIPSNAQGFYACVNDTGKLAKVFHRGIVDRLLGNDTVYELDTQAFARTVDVGLSSPEFSLPTPGIPSINTPSKVIIHNLGGAVACGGTGPLIPTNGTANFNPGTNLPLPAPGNMTEVNVEPGTTLNITAQVNSTVALYGCDWSLSANSSTDHGRQVLTLRNGDVVPKFQPYANQAPIADFLQPYINENTRQVQLAENQAIFLFELGVQFDDSEPINNQHAAFDMQDLVVVATIEAQ